MSRIYRSYVVGWVPAPDTDLGLIGATLTGWCPDTAFQVPPRVAWAEMNGLLGKPSVASRTGFFAPLGASFVPENRRNLWRLERSLEDLAGTLAPWALPRMQLAAQGESLSLVLTDTCRDASRLLAEVRLAMVGTTGFRAAASPRALALSLGKARSAARAKVVRRIGSLVAPVLSKRSVLADIALMGEMGRGQGWEIVERFPLSAGTGDRAAPGPLTCFGPTLLTHATLGTSDPCPQIGCQQTG